MTAAQELRRSAMVAMAAARRRATGEARSGGASERKECGSSGARYGGPRHEPVHGTKVGRASTMDGVLCCMGDASTCCRTPGVHR